MKMKSSLPLNKDLLILFTGRTSLGELRGKPMMLRLTVVPCMLMFSLSLLVGKRKMTGQRPILLLEDEKYRVSWGY